MAPELSAFVASAAPPRAARAAARPATCTAAGVPRAPRTPRAPRADRPDSVYELLRGRGAGVGREGGGAVGGEALRARVRAHAEGGRVREAFREVRGAGGDDVGVEVLDALVEACGGASLPGRAARVVEELFPRYGVRVQGSTCVALVRAWGRVGDVGGVLAVLRMECFFDLEEEGRAGVYEGVVDALARCGGVEEAIGVVRTCKKDGVRVSERMYAALVRGCARARPLHVTLRVMREMKADGVCPRGVDTYNAVLEGCARAGRLLTALDVVERMRREGRVRPDLGTYNALLACCGKARDPGRAREVLREMRANGVRPTAVSYNSVVVACAGVGDVDGARDVAKEMRARGIVINVVTYNNLLEACCNANRVEDAFVLTKEMIAVHDVCPNVVTYNTLIRGCGRWGKLDAALRVLTSMRAGGVSPTVVTYSVAVAACARAGGVVALRRAFSLIKEMRRAGVRPNVVTYNSLLHACARAGDADRAFLVLDEMRAQPVRPDIVTLCSVVDACGRAGRVDEAFEAMRMLPQEFPSLQPNVPAYNALIHACYKAGSVERMSVAFRDMRRCGLRANVVTYSTFVAAYAAVGDMDRALKTVGTMHRRQVRPNRLTYTSIVAGYGRLGKATEALAVLQEARESCGRLDEELYTAAIVAAVHGDCVEKALELAEEMKGVGLDLPHVLNTLMLRGGAVERTGDELSDLLSAIETLGIRPTRAACESLVSVYAVEGNVSGAFGVLPVMVRLHYPPNLHTYKLLIECCGLASDLRRAQMMFATLRREGKVAGRTLRTHHWVQLYEAMLTAIVTVGDRRMAEKYLQGMRRDCGEEYAAAARLRITAAEPDSDLADGVGSGA